MGANDRVQLGLIGCGERGRSDMGNFVKTGTVDVVAVCDIYARPDRPGQADGAPTPRPSATIASCSR